MIKAIVNFSSVAIPFFQSHFMNFLRSSSKKPALSLALIGSPQICLTHLSSELPFSFSSCSRGLGQKGPQKCYSKEYLQYYHWLDSHSFRFESFFNLFITKSIFQNGTNSKMKNN